MYRLIQAEAGRTDPGATEPEKRAFTVPNRSTAASSQQVADDLFRRFREGTADLALSDEDLQGLSSILKQPVSELRQLCR
ncbi:MAG TPA: hypothetical protein PK089_00425 [Methanoregulaceae archaeon]|nr:hypothetical protein [Methanoregulaceae archaeon]HQJ87440.1 hypothetical protein [Methanoregulaceae archaeon]